MQHKAQSAIEFISSYGFSFLIIIIAISVLFIFTSLPRKILPDYCNFYGGFTCADVLYTNTSTGSSLVVAAVASQPGIVNASNFTATLNYQHSVSGYCTPSYALAGQRIYCIANFTFNGTYGTPYIGTFTIQSNYCANPPGNVSTAACAASTTYNFSGNVRAEMSNVNISGSHTLSVTITNTQGSAVPAQFQQMLQFAPSTYQLYERSDLGNIRFYYKNRELYSWCETNCTSTSTSNAVFWMKLPTAVPASANIILTMQFLPRSVSYGDGYAGEAPQLSPTYAEYDNGASIFNFYDNFAGTSLATSNWNIVSGLTYTVNNGFTYSGGSCNHVYVTSSTAFNDPYIMDVYAKGSGATSDDMGIWFNAQARGTTANTLLFAQRGSGSTDTLYSGNPAPTTFTGYLSGTYSLSGTYHVDTLSVGKQNNQVITEFDYATNMDATNIPSTYSHGYIGPRWCTGSESWQWIRVRSYPTNGVMPTYSIS